MPDDTQDTPTDSAASNSPSSPLPFDPSPAPASGITAANIEKAQSPGGTRVSEGDGTKGPTINEVYSGDSPATSSEE